MRVLIIEDDQLQAEHALHLFEALYPESQLEMVVGSISDIMDWFKTHTMPDLILMSSELSGKSSLEIFNQVDITAKVIFTTEYDEYTLNAFKGSNMEYLLKPIENRNLKRTVKRVMNDSGSQEISLFIEKFFATKQKFKQQFLIKINDELQFITTEQIQYIFTNKDVTVVVTANNGKFPTVDTLDQIIEHLDDRKFFRINRFMIVQLGSIRFFNSYINGKLKVELSPKYKPGAIVAKERVEDFKIWLDQ